MAAPDSQPEVSINGSITIETPNEAFRIGGWDGRPTVFFNSFGGLLRVYRATRGLGPKQMSLPFGQLFVVAGGRPLARFSFHCEGVRLALTPMLFIRHSGLSPDPDFESGA